ncbi:thioredoxin family protein [Alkalibacillus aidingensis]|uniref:thioredoxin family protein n=1 Tax=Alkalibacillus aidingensis TaxID=2747607 RepID=UPI0016612F10|nr:thioredoxin family protein [Alkalibacillus aidingensis]
MKKLIIFGSVIVVFFVAIALLTNASQTVTVEDNPYGKDSLERETAELLDDPNYQNIILPEELDTQLEEEDEVTVYFYSPTCEYCQETTPRLAPLAEEMGVDLVQYNLLEFEEGWNDYDVDSTPTLVHYEDGEEVQRIVGAAPNEDYEAFFNTYVLD